MPSKSQSCSKGKNTPFTTPAKAAATGGWGEPHCVPCLMPTAPWIREWGGQPAGEQQIKPWYSLNDVLQGHGPKKCQGILWVMSYLEEARPKDVWGKDQKIGLGWTSAQGNALQTPGFAAPYLTNFPANSLIHSWISLSP